MKGSLVAFGAQVAARGPTVVRDIAGLGGAAAIAYGAGLVYLPAGWITGGILMLIGVFLHARADAAGAPPSAPPESGL